MTLRLLHQLAATKVKTLGMWRRMRTMRVLRVCQRVLKAKESELRRKGISSARSGIPNSHPRNRWRNIG